MGGSGPQAVTGGRRRRPWGRRWGPAAAALAAAALLAALAAAPAALPGRSLPAAGPAAPGTAAALAASVAAAVPLGGPALASPGTGRLDLYRRSAGGAVVHQRSTPGGGWSASLGLGGAPTSEPGAVSRGAGRLDVFVRGSDGALWQRFYRQGSGWSGWVRLGGSPSSEPAVASWGPGRLDVFVRGSDGALWQRYFQQGSGWSAWVRQGGAPTSEPAAAARGPGRLDVFVRGSTGALEHRAYRRGSGWSAWASLGGALRAGPAAAAPGQGQVTVVARRGDGRLWTRTAGAGPFGAWTLVDAVGQFRGLGAWVDLYDRALVPAAAVQVLRAHGVRTLYLQTARFSSPADVVDPARVGAWVEQAHAAGIRVVGWYLPGYGRHLRVDVRRTVAISGYRSPAGQRFDALAVDIESRAASASVAAFDRDVVAHLARVRAAVRGAWVVGAIVPAPLGMELAPRSWAGFPWADIGTWADVVQPMGYWSYRTDCATRPRHCPYGYTVGNVTAARERTGLPVHVIGGLAGDSGPADVAEFVRAARDAGADGGSLYDLATTPPAAWPPLERLGRP